MTVRRIDESECPAVLEVYHGIIDGMRDSPLRPTWRRGEYPVEEDLRAAARDGGLYAAEEGGAFVGAFVRSRSQSPGYERVHWGVDAPPERVAVLHLRGVRPGPQRRGVGHALVKKALEICRAERCLAVRLDSLPWNTASRRLYESEGFAFRGEQELYYPGTGTISFAMYEYVFPAPGTETP